MEWGRLGEEGKAEGLTRLAIRTGGLYLARPGAYLYKAPMVRRPASAPTKDQKHIIRWGGSLNSPSLRNPRKRDIGAGSRE